MIAHGNKIKLFAGNGTPKLAQAIAKELNMTPSMVSRAFNPEAKVSEEKRQIVLETAKKYHFSQLDQEDFY